MTSNELPEISDNELVEKIRQGDLEAFHEIVLRYEKKVLAVAFGIVHNEFDAKDVAQNVFLKMHKSLDKFRGDSRFYTWLYRITVNVAIDFMRKNKRTMNVEFDDHIKLDIDSDVPVSAHKKSLPRDEVMRDELYEKMRSAIDSLSDEHRSALVLREMEDLSYQEIAETLNCSIGTVMSRLYYARRKVQKLLKPYLNGQEV
ncbi:MAG: sigma-70 family RNA polymerase sigma factor [Candidatus Auribacterota bacterium]|jgi:RNA polymerase sigma-70 factor (ECF subfamily)|nr:sigma-70 family RNA polymerase sigma factor [Candidatus Auribacterota bacterium]